MNRISLCAIHAITMALLMSPNIALAVDPPVTTGLVYWADASDIDGDGTIEEAGESGLSGGSIDAWVDRAGGFVVGDGVQNATGSGGTRPTYDLAGSGFPSGLPVVKFDGLDDVLHSTPFSSILNQPNTVIVLFKADENPPFATPDRFIVDGLSGGARNAIFISAGLPNPTLIPFAGNTGSGVGNVNVLVPLSVAATFNGGGSQTYINGVLGNTGDAGGSPMDGVTLGSRFAPEPPQIKTLDGAIAEVLVYDRALSESEIVSVHSYLNDKWLIPEPSSALLLALGAAACFRQRRRNRVS